MKFKAIVLALTLTVVSWAQTSSKPSPIDSGTPAAAAASSGPACHQGNGKDASCCAKMSGAGKDEMSCCAQHDATAGKDSMACCHHDAKDAGQPMSCCKDTDCKSCTKAGKTANSSTVAGCCPDGACCAKGKPCCESAKNTATAMACCSGAHGGATSHTTSPK